MTIEQRLSGLESSARRWRIAAIALALALTVVAGMAAAPRVPDEIRAKRFTVVNDNGTVMGTWDHEEGGGSIQIQNERGRPVCRLGGNAKLASFEVRTRLAKVSLSAGTDGSALSLTNAAGDNSASIIATPIGGSILVIDEVGNTVFSTAKPTK